MAGMKAIKEIESLKSNIEVLKKRLEELEGQLCSTHIGVTVRTGNRTLIDNLYKGGTDRSVGEVGSDEFGNLYFAPKGSWRRIDADDDTLVIETHLVEFK